VDGDRVSVGQLVQLVEPVVHRFVFVGEHRELVVLNRHAGDHADGPVEDARGSFLVVVAQLGDLVADAEHPAAVTPLGLPFPVGRERLLQQQVQVSRPRRAAVHRAQGLHIAARVQAEFRRDTARDEVDDQLGGLFGVVTAEPEEVAEAAERGLVPGVDPVRVDHDPGLLGLPEDLRQPHHRQRPGGEHVAQHLAGPDRRQLVDVADQEQVRAGRDRLDELVGQDHVDHRGFVDHDQVGVKRVGGVEGRVSART
jgi:hypothetical protein